MSFARWLGEAFGPRGPAVTSLTQASAPVTRRRPRLELRTLLLATVLTAILEPAWAVALSLVLNLLPFPLSEGAGLTVFTVTLVATISLPTLTIGARTASLHFLHGFLPAFFGAVIGFYPVLWGLGLAIMLPSPTRPDGMGVALLAIAATVIALLWSPIAGVLSIAAARPRRRNGS